MAVWSGGPLTPAGTTVFGGASNCSASTCLKAPQNCFKEGRLKSFCANNVDIPFAMARRLKPCPRKATVRSEKQPRSYVTVYINDEGLKAINFTKSAFHEDINTVCSICFIS